MCGTPAYTYRTRRTTTTHTHALTHVQRKSLARTPAQDLHNTPLLQPHPRLEVE